MLPRVHRPDSSQITGSSHGPFVVSACIYMVITSSKSKDQPSKIVNPARGQLKVAVNTIVPRSPFFLFLYLKTQTVTHIRKNAVEYLRQ